MEIDGQTIEWGDDSEAFFELMETTSFVDEEGNVTEFTRDEEAK
jgi:hypothetical protein